MGISGWGIGNKKLLNKTKKPLDTTGTHHKIK